MRAPSPPRGRSPAKAATPPVSSASPSKRAAYDIGHVVRSQREPRPADRKHQQPEHTGSGEPCRASESTARDQPRPQGEESERNRRVRTRIRVRRFVQNDPIEAPRTRKEMLEKVGGAPGEQQHHQAEEHAPPPCREQPRGHQQRHDQRHQHVDPLHLRDPPRSRRSMIDHRAIERQQHRRFAVAVHREPQDQERRKRDRRDEDEKATRQSRIRWQRGRAVRPRLFRCASPPVRARRSPSRSCAASFPRAARRLLNSSSCFIMRTARG